MKELINNLKVTAYSSGDISTIAYTGWVAMTDYNNFLAAIQLSVASSTGITTFAIWAAEDASATNAHVVKSHAVGTACDAVGDMLVLEVTAEEIKAIGVAQSHNLDYVSVKATGADSTVRAIMTYIRGNPRVAAANLTADVTA